MHDPVHALVPAPVPLLPAGTGPLDGIDVAVKDLISIAGHTTSFGAPAWRNTHEPARQNAPLIEALRAAGATVVGVAKMEQLAFSLIGNVSEAPAPLNTHCPDLWCGGSSSGSAAAVGAGMVQLAVGTDTGGSMRVPAAACAINSIRPTHGVLDATGTITLAPSFDTLGYFADDLTIIDRALAATAASLTSTPIRRVLAARDVLDQLPPGRQRVFAEAAQRLASHVELGDIAMAHMVTPDISDLFTRIELREIWRGHGSWLDEHIHELEDDVRSRLLGGRKYAEASAADVARDEAEREKLTQELLGALGSDTAVLLPIRFDRGPNRAASSAELLAFRRETFRLTGPASLAGLPQVVSTVKDAESGGFVALSLLGPRRGDRALCQLAHASFGLARTLSL